MKVWIILQKLDHNWNIRCWEHILDIILLQKLLKFTTDNNFQLLLTVGTDSLYRAKNMWSLKLLYCTLQNKLAKFKIILNRSHTQLEKKNYSYMSLKNLCEFSILFISTFSFAVFFLIFSRISFKIFNVGVCITILAV